MSKLLARAKVKRVNAEYDYQNISIDDAYIDDCCYNLEQAIEFALKYLVEMNGENYVENHDIRAQMNKLKSLNAYIPCEKELRLHASTINSWEVETRYNDNFVALIEDINDIKDIADAIIDYCDSLVKPIHDMKLYDDAFNLIKNKTKTIEMRLNDEKRKLLKKGDFIRFTNTLTGEKLICEIIDIYKYKTFTELYKHHDKVSIGYKKSDNPNPDDMLAYYSYEDINKYGVLAIKIKV